MSLNTAIGLAMVTALPALAIWTALSLHVLLFTDRRVEWSNYRLSVTAFLVMTTLLGVDLVRLRYHMHILGVAPNPESWGVFIVRWLWWVAVWWCTVVLYGHIARSAWRTMAHWLDCRHELDGLVADPYLAEDQEATESYKIRRQRVRARRLSNRLTRIDAELDRIITRIKTDDPLILPDDAADTQKDAQ